MYKMWGAMKKERDTVSDWPVQRCPFVLQSVPLKAPLI